MTDTATSGTTTAEESSLSSWAGPYVTEMLGRGQALASQPFTTYSGPLTAGPSVLQNQAFYGLAGLTIPSGDATTYNPMSYTDTGVADRYMSPYMSAALEPQLAEARRQADISRVTNAGRLTKAGAYGGSRQAIMESEADRNLLRNLADIYGTGMEKAYETGMGQFNTEEARRMAATGQAQQYGLAALGAQQQAGATERDIEQQGITADINQFKEERDFPYKQVQYMQSLLQGLPLQTQTYNTYSPSGLQSLSGLVSGTSGLFDLFKNWGTTPAASTTTTPATTTTAPK